MNGKCSFILVQLCLPLENTTTYNDPMWEFCTLYSSNICFGSIKACLLLADKKSPSLSLIIESEDVIVILL